MEIFLYVAAWMIVGWLSTYGLYANLVHDYNYRMEAIWRVSSRKSYCPTPGQIFAGFWLGFLGPCATCMMIGYYIIDLIFLLVRHKPKWWDTPICELRKPKT